MSSPRLRSGQRAVDKPHRYSRREQLDKHAAKMREQNNPRLSAKEQVRRIWQEWQAMVSA